jgi:hypothetical protein
MTRSVRALFTTVGMCALLLVTPTVVRATPVIFTNFGPGFSYDTTAGNPVGADPFLGPEWQGETFTPGGTAQLGTIRVALSDAGGSLDPITVALRNSVAGQPDGIIESFVIPGGTAGLLGANNPPFVLTSLLNPVLTAGVQYWLTVQASPNSAYVWNWNNTGENAPHAVSQDSGGSWFVDATGFFTPGAFELDARDQVAAVPEPGTLLLVVTGTGALIRRRRLHSGKSN